MENFLYWDDTTRDIVNSDGVYIYGAGLMGRTLKECLSKPPYMTKIKGFLVKEMRGNPSYISGIPVNVVCDDSTDRNELVLVALHEKNLKSAINILTSNNFSNIRVISFDSDEWSHIRGNWINSQKMLDEKSIYYEELSNSKIIVYVVKSVFDKVLKGEKSYKNYEVPVQVGKALCDKRICKLTDDVGENISYKNRQYCELTALYWLWKHKKSDYIGLSHYRRRFVLSYEQIRWLVESDVDVVVTTPIINLEGVGKQYSIDHFSSDWEMLKTVIKDVVPEYYEYLLEVQDGKYYYGYNMFIARYDIFCAYCEWLFRILQECEKRIGKKDDDYQNRYIGFLAERLLTVYIKKKQLKLLIVDKHFINE